MLTALLGSGELGAVRAARLGVGVGRPRRRPAHVGLPFGGELLGAELSALGSTGGREESKLEAQTWFLTPEEKDVAVVGLSLMVFQLFWCQMM